MFERLSKLFSSKDDPFIFLKNISTTLLYHKTMKYPAIFSVLYNLPVVLMQIIYIKKNFSINLMIESGPSILITVYALIATIGLFVHESDIKSFLLKISTSTLAILQGQTENIAKSDHFWAVMWILALNIFGFISGVCFFFVLKRDKSITLTVVPKMVEEYFGGASDVLILIYCITILLISYCGGLVFVIFTVYSSLHEKIQITMLNKYIHDMSDGPNEPDLCHLEEYQNEIYKRLCFAIERHIIAAKFLNEALDKFYLVFVMLLSVGFLAAISSFILIFNNITSVVTLRLITVTTLSIVSFLLVVLYHETSQRLFNESERTFNLLYDCPWYNWNLKNRKTLLLFMINAPKPIVLSINGIVVLNFEFLKKFMQSVYSTGMVFYQLKADQ